MGSPRLSASNLKIPIISTTEVVRNHEHNNKPRRIPGGVCYAHNGPNLLVVWVDNQPIGVHI